MKKYTWFITCTLCMLMLSSCHFFESTVVDGGPCSYKDTKLVARVVALETYDSIHYDVILKLDSNALIMSPNDTISYTRETHDYFEKTALDSAGIKIGNRYTYLVRDIIEGHCSPHITRLILETPQ